MKFPTTLLPSIIAVAIILVGSTQSSAGIQVDATTGVITQWTTTTSYDNTTTYYFSIGSYDSSNPQPTLIDENIAEVLSRDLAADINAYTPSPTPSTQYMYLFAWDVQSDTGDPLVDTFGTYYAGVFSQWVTDGSVPPLPLTTESLNGYTFVWATTTPPSTAGNVPEPSTAIAMGLLGVVGFAGNRRRRRQVSAA